MERDVLFHYKNFSVVIVTSVGWQTKFRRIHTVFIYSGGDNVFQIYYLISSTVCLLEQTVVEMQLYYNPCQVNKQDHSYTDDSCDIELATGQPYPVEPTWWIAVQCVSGSLAITLLYALEVGQCADMISAMQTRLKWLVLVVCRGYG